MCLVFVKCGKVSYASCLGASSLVAPLLLHSPLDTSNPHNPLLLGPPPLWLRIPAGENEPMRRGIWSVPSTLSSYIKTPLPTLCFTFFFRVPPGPPSLYLPLCFWSWGTYLLRLTELQPRVLQHMLVTHGVALKVAAFPCHHITPQGKEAGLQVIFPESDLKREEHQSQPLQQGSLTMPRLMPQAALAHRATSLSPQ